MLTFNTVQICEVKYPTQLLAYLVAHYPDSKYLDYHYPGSESYTTIAGWCNIDNDLKEYHYGILKTQNSLLFCPKKKAFVDRNLDENLNIYCCFSDFVPKPVDIYIDCGGEFIRESTFSKHDIDTMRSNNIIGPSLEIHEMFLK